jgi:ribonuclease HII
VLDIKIRAKAKAFGIGWVSSEEVDALGLTGAVRLAMDRAVAEIPKTYDEIIIDGNYNFLAHLPKTSTLIKADDKIPAVSAASIIAKVARDNWMATKAAQQFPLYGFERHVGYGTALHRAAIELHGICDLHRRCFAPIRLKNELDAEIVLESGQL